MSINDDIRRAQNDRKMNILKGFVVSSSDRIEKAEETDIEKGHNVGDAHPNGKWVWTQLPSGKYDWRNAAKTGSKPAANADPNKPYVHMPDNKTHSAGKQDDSDDRNGDDPSSKQYHDKAIGGKPAQASDKEEIEYTGLRVDIANYRKKYPVNAPDFATKNPVAAKKYESMKKREAEILSHRTTTKPTPKTDTDVIKKQPTKEADKPKSDDPFTKEELKLINDHYSKQNDNNYQFYTEKVGKGIVALGVSYDSKRGTVADATRKAAAKALISPPKGFWVDTTSVWNPFGGGFTSFSDLMKKGKSDGDWDDYEDNEYSGSVSYRIKRR